MFVVSYTVILYIYLYVYDMFYILLSCYSFRDLWNVCVCVYIYIYITHQLLAYANDVNILGGSTHMVKENAEALVVATKEIGLEVSADKTKYMVMS